MKLIILFLYLQALFFVLARKKTTKATTKNKVKIDANIIAAVDEYQKNYTAIQNDGQELKENKIREQIEKIETLVKFSKDSNEEFLKNVIEYFSKLTDKAQGQDRFIRIINHAERLLFEKHITNSDKDDQFNAAESLSEKENFIATEEKDFYQPAFKSACQLYSKLFAFTKNEYLLNELNKLVKKSSTAYIIKLEKNYYSVPISDVKTIESKNSKSKTIPPMLGVDELSPSSNLLIIAFGMALQKASRNSAMEDYIDQEVAYNMANFAINGDTVDVIFGKQIIYGVDIKKNTTEFESIFKSDGKVNINGINYSGDFIVSFTTYIAEGKGHATSAYFIKPKSDESNGKWMYFDNFLEPHILELNSSNMKNTKYFKFDGFNLIGNPQIENRKKLKKKVIK